MTLTIHDLKCLSQYFDALKSGEKTFELRRMDRDYKIGDVLCLRKWGGSYRDAYWPDEAPLYLEISYMLWRPVFGLKHGYGILAVKPIEADSWVAAQVEAHRSAADTLCSRGD